MNHIALLVPCYNASKYIDDFLNSINKLIIPFDEVIFYDDGSSDDTVKKLKENKQKVICGKKNKGAAYARNKLIDACNSNWIHFHDIDDDFTPNIVEVFKKNISNPNNSHIDAFICNMLVIDNLTKKTVGNIVYNNISLKINPIAYFLQKNGFAIIGCYKKEILQKIKGFNIKLRGNEDPDLHIRLALQKVTFYHINEYLSINKVNSNSFSQLNWTQCMKDKLYTLFTYRKKLNRTELDIIGNEAIKLANYFYRENEYDFSKRAKKIALIINAPPNISTGANLIIKYFGIKAYLLSYRIRINIKKQLQ